MKRSFFSSTQIITGTLIALFLCVIFLQAKNDDLGPKFTTKFIVTNRNILPEKIVPYLSFGFTNLLADYYWLSATQDLSGWNTSDDFYLNYFRNISKLDPKFEYPYLFSIFAVPQTTNQNQKKYKDITVLNDVASIAERGIQAIPTSWQIPFYLGTQYYIFTKKYTPAEEYLATASKVQGAPIGVYLTYSSFISKNNGTYKTSRDLIKVIYNNTDNEVIKKLASKGLQEELIVQILEKGITAYKAKYKQYPKTVEEMLAKNLVSFPDGFLEVFTVEINQRNGSFRVRER